METAGTERCRMCGARALVAGDRDGWQVCGWCGAGRHRDAASLPALRPGRIEDQVPAGWHIDDYVARGWAAGQGLDYRADRLERARGHSPEPARGALVAMAEEPPHAVALAVIAREADAALARLGGQPWLKLQQLSSQFLEKYESRALSGFACRLTPRVSR